MMNNYLSLLRRCFEDEIKIPQNVVCKECDAQIKNPLLPWHVGKNYSAGQQKILFVGKPHRGRLGEKLPTGVIDPTDEIDGLRKKGWAYWSYTQDIASAVYGDIETGWSRIALTNLIKCTNVGAADDDSSIDRTSFTMAQNCIRNLGVIASEILILKPTDIVFYTYSLYPELLADLAIVPGTAWRDVTPPETRVPCGAKMLGWWERVASAPWCDEIRVLICGHPERMKKDAYIGLIARWILKRSNA